MLRIAVTLAVLKLETSKLVNPLQLENISLIFVTSEVSSNSKFLIVVSLENALNIELDFTLALIFPAPYHEEPDAIVGADGNPTTNVAVAAVDDDSAVTTPGAFAS